MNPITQEYELGDNVIVTSYRGENTAIITKVYPKFAGSNKISYELYGQDFCIITDSESMRLAPNTTMVLSKGG